MVKKFTQFLRVYDTFFEGYLLEEKKEIVIRGAHIKLGSTVTILYNEELVSGILESVNSYEYEWEIAPKIDDLIIDGVEYDLSSIYFIGVEN